MASLLAAAVLFLCLFSRLDALGLVGPDEPRYAAVAREMAESGDWVTPRLHGKPWFEKPVLYYWAAAAAFRLFGTGEFAARLPSALAALANLYTLWHARQLRAQAAEHLAGMTRLEKRSAAIILVSATASLLMVLFEIIAHALYHGSPL